MCKSPLHPFLQALPKCEHHVHLEGTLSPSLLFELSSKNKIPFPKNDAAYSSIESLIARYNRFQSLDDFLQYYYIGMGVLVDSSDFEALAWEYFQRAAHEGVHHAEVFFDPQAHTSRGVPYSTVLEGFNSARKRAKSELRLTTELICCFLRHLPVEDSLSTFQHEQVQASLMGGQIKGIGLDSSEKGFPPHLFTEIYKEASQMGLSLTAHAGEEGPVDYISGALNELGVERIDHGIKLADSPELMKHVAAREILLTVCPLSNVLLKCAAKVADLPIRKFLDAGVKFSINSDDPAYFGGYILANYCAVHEAFDLSVEEWVRICKNGIEGSWCEMERKEAMLEQLAKVATEWASADS